MISTETMQVLEERGFDSVDEYLEDLADETGHDIETVYMLYSMLGETELFDGLVTSLQDM